LAYTLIDMGAGDLPWKMTRALNGEVISDDIAVQKKNAPISVICAGLPEVF